ncbi:unnamed protein product [Prunus brigantina]
MTEKFSCRAKDLFEILMDENRWKVCSQSNAKISKEVGGQISIFDGSVTGTNLELQNGSLIVQKWRFGSWLDGIESTICQVFFFLVGMNSWLVLNGFVICGLSVFCLNFSR